MRNANISRKKMNSLMLRRNWKKSLIVMMSRRQRSRGTVATVFCVTSVLMVLGKVACVSGWHHLALVMMVPRQTSLRTPLVAG